VVPDETCLKSLRTSIIPINQSTAILIDVFIFDNNVLPKSRVDVPVSPVSAASSSTLSPMGQSPKDAKKNARELLEKVLAAKEESKDKNWKPS